MLLKELTHKVGKVIEFYIVEGYKIEIRKGLIEYDGRNYITIKVLNKNGKYCGYNKVISIIGYGKMKYCKIITGCWNTRVTRLYISKEDAYSYLIEKLKNERQMINKKIVEIQKTLNYGRE